MKNVYLAKLIYIIFVTYPFIGIAQISTTTRVYPKIQVDSIYYDSLKATLDQEEIGAYIGQDLYLVNVDPIYDSIFGFEGFMLDFQHEPNKVGNVYRPNPKYPKYSSPKILGSYFKVLEIVSIQNGDPIQSELIEYFFKLKDKASGKLLYYRFSASMPFIIVGYFEHKKKELKGKSCILSFKNDEDLKFWDFKTGRPITHISNERWTFKDLTVENKRSELSVICQNQFGENLLIGLYIFELACRDN